MDRNQQEVHEVYCVNLIRPPDTESCNSHACEFVWIAGEWTQVRAREDLCAIIMAFSPYKGSELFAVEQAVFYFSKRPFIWITNPVVRK